MQLKKKKDLHIPDILNLEILTDIIIFLYFFPMFYRIYHALDDINQHFITSNLLQMSLATQF